mmetsp:Transcript_28690/g.78899  ORF Transcript_28690/g.78899 Transcript_28690/m.78899 type:complete len:228 (-) Transcript_28690:913-1596(-)
MRSRARQLSWTASGVALSQVRRLSWTASGVALSRERRSSSAASAAVLRMRGLPQGPGLPRDKRGFPPRTPSWAPKWPGPPPAQGLHSGPSRHQPPAELSKCVSHASRACLSANNQTQERRWPESFSCCRAPRHRRACPRPRCFSRCSSSRHDALQHDRWRPQALALSLHRRARRCGSRRPRVCARRLAATPGNIAGRIRGAQLHPQRGARAIRKRQTCNQPKSGTWC